jgi:hypothetical protein
MSTNGVASLTAARLLKIFNNKSGRVWVAARDAVRDNGVRGQHLAAHMDSHETLRSFFQTELGCTLTPLVARDLHTAIVAACAADAQAGSGTGGGTGSGASAGTNAETDAETNAENRDGGGGDGEQESAFAARLREGLIRAHAAAAARHERGLLQGLHNALEGRRESEFAT